MTDRTPCKVIGIRNGVQRNGRRGVPAMPAGSMLYYLWHEGTKLWYIEAYANEAYAIKKAAETYPPLSMSEVASHWRPEPKYCFHSYRTED